MRILLVAALLLTGCTSMSFAPAVLYSHTSDPRNGKPFNDNPDSETDLLGGGGCWSTAQTDACVVAGVRHEAVGSGYETVGFATQALVLHKFKGKNNE